MKESKVIPSWVSNHKVPGAAFATLEEMSAVQVKNMMGQYLKPNLKELMKKDPELRSKIEDSLREIVNAVKMPTQDEKPTLIWLVKQVSSGSINHERLEEDKPVITANLVNFYKYRRELKKLVEYNYVRLVNALADLMPPEEETAVEAPKTLTDALARPWRTGGDFKVYEVTDQNIAMKMAEGTSWCTQGEHYSGHYLSMGPLYVLYKNNKRYAQLHFHSGQFMDVRDVPITPEMFKEINEALPGAFNKQAHETMEDYPFNGIFANDLTGQQTADLIEQDNKAADYIDLPPEFAENIADTIIKRYQDPKISNNEVVLEKTESGLKISARWWFFSDKFNLGVSRHSRDEISNESMKDLLDNSGFFDNDYGTDVKNVFDDISEKNIEKIKRVFEQNSITYEDDDEFEDLVKQGEDYDVNSAIYRAGETGYAYGAESEFYDDCTREIVNAGFKEKKDDNKGASWYEAIIPFSKVSVFLQISREKYIDCLFAPDEDRDDPDPYFDLHVTQPYYGWSGFDEDAFNERLSEQLDELIKTDEEISAERGKEKLEAEKKDGQGVLFEEYMKRVEGK